MGSLFSCLLKNIEFFNIITYNMSIIYKEIKTMSIQNNKDRLSPQFDLLYDLKFMYEVETIANGEGSHSDASPEDLVDLFNELGVEVPECLSSFTGSTFIWVLPNGHWLSYEPLSHEEPNAQKVKINKFN